MSEKTTVRLSRVDVIAAMSWAGWGSAGKWDNARLAERLPQIKDVMPSGTPGDEKVAACLTEILAGLEAGAKFEVYNPEGVVSPEPEAAKPAGKSDEDKAAEKALKEAARAAKKAEREQSKAVRDAAKAEKKAAREAARAAKKAASGKGDTKGRGYYAGVVCKKHGYATITDAMIAEVDALYGKPNPVVSRGALHWAQTALQGYFEVAKAAEPQAAVPSV